MVSYLDLYLICGRTTPPEDTGIIIIICYFFKEKKCNNYHASSGDRENKTSSHPHSLTLSHINTFI